MAEADQVRGFWKFSSKAKMAGWSGVPSPASAGRRFGYVGGVTPKPLKKLARKAFCAREPFVEREEARFRPGTRA